MSAADWAKCLSFGFGIRAQIMICVGGPNGRHPDEVLLQCRAFNAVCQLYAIRCQAQAFKLTLSQIVRVEHGAPP
jgi:hypothetical protein